MNKILKLQKRGIRIVLNLKAVDSVKGHFKNLELLMVFCMYIYETILIAYNKNKKVPLKMVNLLTIIPD